ncbi:ABC transporter ATP-binding protein [Phycisphaerales bacterium AB-hyl4]|uniref:ABC transporter ATP-binding protein n=1 Tax=Natronomicrosphaera hydrolytica TaxID=3242702 RepID=A0ABV4UAH0_9BACT
MPVSAPPPSDGPVLDLRKHSLREIAARLGPILRPHRGRLVVGCTLIAIAGGIFGVMPLFLKYLIDEAIPQRSMQLTLLISGGFVLTHAIRTGIWFIAMQQILLTQEKITFALRNAGFSHLQRLSLRFHHRFPSGFLYQSVFGTAINAVGGAMQTIFKQLSLYIVAMATSLIACLMLSVPMTAIILAGCVGYVVISRWTSPQIYRATRLKNESQNQISDFIVDRLRGTRTIQAMAIEQQVEDEFATRLWPAQLRALDAVKQTFRLSVITNMAGYFVTACIMLAGAYAIFEMDLSLGDLVAFMAYQATFITIVATLTNVWGDITAARAGLDQLLTILNTPSHVEERPHATMPASVHGDLTLENMSFGYEPDQLVLQNLNLTFPRGQSVALVGASGGGKTTLANLLLRFYDPTHGRILLDGNDIRELPLKNYRSLFGVVLQDPYLFNTSIEANLRCARPEASEAEIIEALDRARAWEFVQHLPGKLQYQVGEGGSRLSGGQRQRLAIARCIMLQSRFVILDEPTSALDVESERAVQEAFDSLFADRTTFVIAHRLSTIRHADRILVLQNGQVIQDGHYDQLVAERGVFQRLHAMAAGTA